VTREKFERLVEDALKMIPKRFRQEMRNVAVVVEDEPPDEILDEMEIPEDDTLFGLYQGTPCRSAAGPTATTCPTASRSTRARSKTRAKRTMTSATAWRKRSSTSSATTSA